jgi:hypothetical protein
MLYQPDYIVIKREGQFQLRKYGAYNIIEAPDSDLDSYRGFRMVFDYIQGDNQSNQKISMTVPVINQLEDQQVQTTAFVMPDEYDMATLPEPLQASLRKIHVAESYVATIRFPLTVSKAKINHNEQKLLFWIKSQGLHIVGPTRLARYNPPFIPGFLKRNELWIEVTDD